MVEQRVNDPSTSWVPPEPSGPPLPLIGAVAAGAVAGAVLLFGVRERKRRQERARHAARERVRRLALLAASQLAAHVVRTVRRGEQIAPAPPPARRRRLPFRR
jgi:hypothetical protein